MAKKVPNRDDPMPFVSVEFNGYSREGHPFYGIAIMPASEWMYYAACVNEKIVEYVNTNKRMPSIMIDNGAFWKNAQDWERSFDAQPVNPDVAQVLNLSLRFRHEKDPQISISGYFPTLEQMLINMKVRHEDVQPTE